MRIKKKGMSQVQSPERSLSQLYQQKLRILHGTFQILFCWGESFHDKPYSQSQLLRGYWNVQHHISCIQPDEANHK